ncbi:hypothetical protein, partial [Mesorhizobium sp. M4B.F.Ca.ET.089.01.1.1]|uniref:hypothetical protein n=1 Tax=Mesorhizobium sp. M4B.F.Ca.ET.089.01.1.1 TaxID=2496662 RepID=UPI001FDF51E8
LIVFFPIALGVRQEEVCCHVKAISRKWVDMVNLSVFGFVYRPEAAQAESILFLEQILLGPRVRAPANAA